MPSPSAAPRLLLFADPASSSTPARVRRYRLARFQPPAGDRRPDAEPRYEYLKRTYD